MIILVYIVEGKLYDNLSVKLYAIQIAQNLCTTDLYLLIEYQYTRTLWINYPIITSSFVVIFIVFYLLLFNAASGLNYPNHKIITTASLGRNVLSTKLSSPRNTTRFDSSLAWKTDANSIKRMKSENIPIKVECFCVGKTGRELIGFVVVPLRTVAILTGNKVMTVSCSTYNLAKQIN